MQDNQIKIFKEYFYNYVQNVNKLLENLDKNEKNVTIVNKYMELRYFFSKIKSYSKKEMKNYINREMKKYVRKEKICCDYERILRILFETDLFLKDENELELLEKEFGIKNSIKKIIKENKKNLTIFEKLYESNYFYLIFNKLKRNVKIVEIKNKVKFSDIYNKKLIEEIFNSGITAEDKLKIEYNMIVLSILKDIIYGKFNQLYILEFEYTLLEKENKLKRFFSIVDDEWIKDRISFLIKEDTFYSKKEVIYELMRNGYKFTLVLNNGTELSNENEYLSSIFENIIQSNKTK